MRVRNSKERAQHKLVPNLTIAAAISETMVVNAVLVRSSSAVCSASILACSLPFLLVQLLFLLVQRVALDA